MPQLEFVKAIHQPARWSASVEISPLDPDALTKLHIVAYSAAGEVMASGSTLWSAGASEGISDALVASWLEWDLGMPGRCALAAWATQRVWAEALREQGPLDQ